ncbi:unnamed protein product [Mycetohabitans rhizoxinica HKI 454]|uniref:Uncharacterized protein n=1 Tax=Mycetohabitans rhizoxinica (strain DSM 19002 / CIP 109453 / HKI 454) TaxID=882378 RepID=E5AL57_MYCRK|nr:unnamed protein product [Mycetohabitans rhizoxinica HKI 454]
MLSVCFDDLFKAHITRWLCTLRRHSPFTPIFDIFFLLAN